MERLTASHFKITSLRALHFSEQSDNSNGNKLFAALQAPCTDIFDNPAILLCLFKSLWYIRNIFR